MKKDFPGAVQMMAELCFTCFSHFVPSSLLQDLEGMVVRGRRQSVSPTPLVPSGGLVTKEDSALPAHYGCSPQ